MIAAAQFGDAFRSDARGEAGGGTTAAAILNALVHAMDGRIQGLPFDTTRVKAALV